MSLKRKYMTTALGCFLYLIAQANGLAVRSLCIEAGRANFPFSRQVLSAVLVDQTPSPEPPPPKSPTFDGRPLIMILLGSTALATLGLYSVNDSNWSIAWAFYFAAQALFGVNYNNLPSTNADLPAITIFLYILGSFICAATVGTFISFAIGDLSNLALDERRRHRATTNPQKLNEGDELEASIDNIRMFHSSTKNILLKALVFWLILGTASSVFFKHIPLSESLFRALGAVSAAGLPAPDPSTFGDLESIFLALYIMIGVPLFSITLGQLSLSIVENAVRESERQILSRPLSTDEFSLVRALHRYDHRHSFNVTKAKAKEEEEEDEEEHVDLSDFIVLELLRLQRVDEDELLAITALFDKLESEKHSMVATTGERRRLRASSAFRHLFKNTREV